jgi:hypothetical protein
LEDIMNHTQEKRMLLDAALFIGFIACFFLELTGLDLHQWLGVAAGAVGIYHLVTHWNWVRAVSQRFFGKTSGQARTYYLLDATILAGFAVMIATGLTISSWFNLALANYAAWLTVHITSAIVTLLAVTVKVWAHGRWILNTGKKLFGIKPQPAGQASGQAAIFHERRAFLRMAGVVGAASLVAFSSSIKGLAQATAPAAETPESSVNSTGNATGASTTSTAAATSSTGTTASTTDTTASTAAAGNTTISTAAAATNSTGTTTSTANTTASTTGATTGSTTANSTSTTACTILCGKRCSYPGRCGRYVDTNNNGRCDRGECLS